MKILLLIFLFFLSSCSSQSPIKTELIFNNDMSFDQFEVKLKEYAESNPYPNIDN